MKRGYNLRNFLRNEFGFLYTVFEVEISSVGYGEDTKIGPHQIYIHNIFEFEVAQIKRARGHVNSTI